MFCLTVNPRFGDIDALGHVNNTVPSCWFENARMPLIRIFDPELTLSRSNFPLILAHTDYDFTGQIYISHEVEIKTWISRIGVKSFTVYHEAFQQGRLCVKGSAVIVYYDFIAEKSVPIPEDKKEILSGHLI